MSVKITNVSYIVSGRTLLDEIDLTAEAGQLVAIVGPNGAGKTTLMRIIAGDIAPSSGEARVNGRDPKNTTLQEMSKLRSYLGPQGASDNPFSVRDVVAMGRNPHRRAQIGLYDHDQIVLDAMARTDVSHLADRSVSSLSTGERQRVGLARVLAQQTPVVLLDEPTSALDIGHQESVMSLLRLLTEGEMTVLTILHDLNLAAAHAHRLVLMAEGKVQRSGTPSDVLVDDILTDVYRQKMRVIDHPDRSCPLVLTLDNQ